MNRIRTGCGVIRRRRMAIVFQFALVMIAFLPATGTNAQTIQPSRRQVDVSAAGEAGDSPHTPVHFVRSGREIEIQQPLTFNRPVKTAVLRAFGRTWTEPFAVETDGMVLKMKVTAPRVRVPTVFSIAWPEPPYVSFAELAAYPDDNVDWDKKLTLYSCGTPAWFDQWAAATGLPVKKVSNRELPSAKMLMPEEEGGKSLLILGAVASGKGLPDVAELAANKNPNVLVLEADWFGGHGGAVSVAPAQMSAGLSEIVKQQWPQMLKFTSHRKPWPGIANRWAWIVDDSGLPLVEEIRSFTPDERKRFPLVANEPALLLDSKPEADTIARLVASYLPWQQQLGRNEHADSLLLALLKAVAGASPRELAWSPIEILHPLPEEITREQRPVLWAMRTGRYWGRDHDQKPEYVSPVNVIVDLRGSEPAVVSGLQEGAEALNPDNNQPHRRLIILGDDKLLDDWKWLKLDRHKKRIGCSGVQWLPADELPPSKDDQIRMMLKLTELGVPLSTRLAQEKQK